MTARAFSITLTAMNRSILTTFCLFFFSSIFPGENVHGQEPGWAEKFSQFLPSSISSFFHEDSAKCQGRPGNEDPEFNLNQTVIQDNNFTVRRGLLDYVDYFSPSPNMENQNPFLNFLEGLGPRDNLLDAGSGETKAMADYLGMTGARFLSPRLNKIVNRPLQNKANVTAVSYFVSGSSQILLRRGEKGKKLNLQTGAYFEDIPEHEIMKGRGKFTAIFDVYGVLAYTSTPDKALLKYLSLLKTGGIIFVKTGPENYDYHPHRPRSSTYRSQVKTANGEPIDLPQWFRKIPGLKVTDINNESLQIELVNPRLLKIPSLKLVKCEICPNPPQARYFEEIAD